MADEIMDIKFIQIPGRPWEWQCIASGLEGLLVGWIRWSGSDRLTLRAFSSPRWFFSFSDIIKLEPFLPYDLECIARFIEDLSPYATNT